MARGKDSVILYQSFFDATAGLKVSAKAELWDCIGEYINGVSHAFKDRSAELAWNFIVRQLDADREKYEERCRKNRENGNRGGRPRENRTDKIEGAENPKKPNGFFKNRNKPNGFFKNPNDTDSDTDSERKKKILKKERSYEEAAERIWQAYPKKDGKQEGIKAILKRLHEGLSEEYLLGRVRAYCVCCEGRDKGYVKNAQGWFNQARYMDASLDVPAPPREGGGISLEEFRLAYRKLHEGDFALDFCPEMERHKAVLSAGYDELLRDYKAEYDDIRARLNEPFSKLKLYVQKTKKGEK